MKTSRKFTFTIACGLAGIFALFSACRDQNSDPERDLSSLPHLPKGLELNSKYTLQNDVFYRVYERNQSLHPPNSLWSNFSISDYRENNVNDEYVKGIVSAGTRLRFTRVEMKDLTTHTIFLYFAVLLNGDYSGQEVLINSLLEEPSEWILKDE